MPDNNSQNKTYLLPVTILFTDQNELTTLLKEVATVKEILAVKLTEDFNKCKPFKVIKKADTSLFIRITDVPEKTAQIIANAYPDRRLTATDGTVVKSTLIAPRNAYAAPAKGIH